MSRYIIKRLFLMIPTLLGVAVFVFLLMRVIPGDIVELRLTSEGGFVTEEVLAMERARLGLDKPVWQQFATWIGGIVRLDFGTSMWTGRPISHEIGIRIQLSLEIAILATVVAILIAIPLGTLAALKQDTWVDYAVRVFSIAGLSMPSFWLGILIILFLLIYFQWVPPMFFTPIWVDPWENLSQMVWPAAAVGYRYSAVSTRMMRSSTLEVLREDYVRTARAKGLWEQVVIVRHAMKNAMLPVITVIGLEFAFLIGGLVVTEQVFNLNGLGKLFVQSIAQRDYTMTQTLVLLVAVTFVMVNFVIDILYAWLDPRIRYG
ncbi:MAG: ABC transporter permease [Candidatus Methylomirabilales bacterium]|nr:ABC transporter permease [candidate division NC10 bacterium]MCH7895968.1 ABC transporter permease [candidate division NC10 bacterium]